VDPERVRSERRGRVLVVTLRREEKRNAIDPEVTAGLDAALNELDDDPELWVGVLTGGSSVFSAGTDLGAGSGEPTERGGDYGVVRRARRKPLIAAVEGPALGGGFEIVLACDLVVASRTATFGLPEVVRGVLPTCGGLFRGPRALPPNVAKELVLLGRPFDAERMRALGVVNRVTEPGEALAGALELATAIAENSPVSVQQSLQAMERALGADDDLGWQATADARAVTLASEDSREGIRAFFERRAPRWTGR
jgi:enoyl-CoA hydratase